MRNFIRVAAACVALGGCGELAEQVSGSCTGTQAIAGVTVNICSESPTLTVSNQATLNTTCRSGQLGAAANNWQQGVACTSTGRVGGCRRTVNGIDVVTWVYSTSASVNATVVRSFCGTISATFQSP